MNMRRLLLPLLLGLSLAACDNSPAGPGSGPAAGTPAQKCVTLLTTLCEKFIMCGEITGTVSACVEGLQMASGGSQGIPCQRATKVSATFDQCIAGLKALMCTQTDTLPSACNQVVSFE